MLAVYRPNEQSAATVDAVKNQLEMRMYRNRKTMVLNQEGDNIELIFTVSWCREIASRYFQRTVGSLPPGKLDIYGIRKHGSSWSNQPTGVLGKICTRSTRTNGLFTTLFHLTTEMVSNIFETDNIETHDAEFWLLRCSHPTSKSLNLLPSPSISCLLNKPDNTPVTSLWTTDTMYGTILGIPSEWAQSCAVMSYLLYIPRIWAEFCDNIIFKELSIVGVLKYNADNLYTMLRGYADPSDRHLVCVDINIWRYMARRLMLPMWFTNYGREQFWIFTYLLIREGLKDDLNIPKDPDLLSALKNNNYSGFMSWMRWYKTKGPVWITKLYKLFTTSGPYALIERATLTSNI